MPARGSSSARSSGARSSTRATRATCRRCRAASRRPRSSRRGTPAPTSSRCFPRRRSGRGYLKDVRAPLPQVKLMPTGGVTLDNAGDWIRAGAVAVGVGTALLDAQGHRGRRLRRARGRTRSGSSRTCGPRGDSGDDAKGRDVRRDHAAAQPAGIRAVAAVAGARARRSAAARPTWRSASRTSASTAGTSRALPKNAIGDAAIRALRAEGVRTDHIVRGGNRVGIYFAESRRQPARVDRHLRPRALGDQRDGAGRRRLDAVFDGADWFHVTGITPALGAERRGGDAASDRRGTAAGARVSVDPELPQEAVDRGAGAGRSCGR